MNIIEKSESIRAGLRKGFQDGSSKIAQRKCYGYDTGPNGELVINPDEAIVVRWIFECYFNGDSLGKISAGLETQGVSLPVPPMLRRQDTVPRTSRTSTRSYPPLTHAGRQN